MEIITLEDWGDITKDETMQQLIGKRIKKIRLNSEYLVLEFEDSVFVATVEGDCCSSSYFYDFYGVEKIINHVIKSIESIELDPTDLKASHNGDVVKVYGYKITCKLNDDDYNPYGESNTGIFSFRNDSNGYYGGNMAFVSGDFDYESVPEITKNVSDV